MEIKNFVVSFLVFPQLCCSFATLSFHVSTRLVYHKWANFYSLLSYQGKEEEKEIIFFLSCSNCIFSLFLRQEMRKFSSCFFGCDEELGMRNFFVFLGGFIFNFSSFEFLLWKLELIWLISCFTAQIQSSCSVLLLKFGQVAQFCLYLFKIFQVWRFLSKFAQFCCSNCSFFCLKSFSFVAEFSQLYA